MGKSIQKKLGELKRLEERATKGPWYTVESPWRPRDGATWVIAGSIDPHLGEPICQPMEILEWEGDEEPTYTQQDADMEFIAAARNYLLGLIQALEIAMIQRDTNYDVITALLSHAFELKCQGATGSEIYSRLVGIRNDMLEPCLKDFHKVEHR